MPVPCMLSYYPGEAHLREFLARTRKIVRKFYDTIEEADRYKGDGRPLPSWLVPKVRRLREKLVNLAQEMVDTFGDRVSSTRTYDYAIGMRNDFDLWLMNEEADE